MPDHTTTSAAAYLAEHGYTVHSKRDGTDKPPPPELVKRWCKWGKLKARKAGWVWLIAQEDLDRLLGAVDKVVGSTLQDTAKDRATMREGESD